MSDKIFEDDELLVKRFSCSCLYPAHILDVSVETSKKDKKWVSCLFEFYLGGGVPWRRRLREIWNMLRGREAELGDFYLRPEDAGELIGLLEKVKKIT